MLVVDRIQLLIHLKNNNKHGSLTRCNTSSERNVDNPMFLYDCKSTFLSNIFYNFVSAKFLKMRADIFSSVRLLIVP